MDSQPDEELQQVESGLADNFERTNFSPSNLFNTAEDDTVKECDEPCCTEGAINQPTDLYLLRKSERVFGSGRNGQKRHFLPSWYKTFHFCATSLKVYCFYCKEMNKINLNIMSTKAEPTFATTGFSNWKKVTTRFKEHESSQRCCICSCVSQFNLRECNATKSS